MLGVVLAGGESRRMGRDKALVEVDGQPLWRRQVAVLRDAGAERVVVVRRRGQESIDYPDCQFDVFQDSGPLAGIHAALGIGSYPLIAVLAVDMPGIDAAWFCWLQASSQPGGGAVASGGDGLEPLAALYPASSLAEVEARLRRRELSVQSLARSLAASGLVSIVEAPAAYAGRLASLNAPPA
jgi:molybdopterin-guanine dinucleotide biosynthesis protein A